jgi:hypothetical protein
MASGTWALPSSLIALKAFEETLINTINEHPLNN